MVIDSYPEIELIKDLDKEIAVLRKIGVDDSEISYLMFLKRKRELGLKWQP